jgi:outer membrane receptor for ferrienterochelin and colicin
MARAVLVRQLIKDGVVRAFAWALTCTLALAGVSAVSTAARAQGTGTVTGQVVNAASKQPITGAYVGVDQGAGTLTRGDGRYTLRLAAGQHTLTVRLIGFAQQMDTVTVTAGGQVTQDFQLHEQALALEEVVVTGQAGASRRREVGNSIAQITAGDVVQPPASVEELMQSRATGLNITQASGGAGGGSYIRLRGNISMSQSNFPLVYVDGVRMRSDPYPPNEAPLSGRGNAAGVAANPMNSINPDDIERVEVIKGPAATTLYGTEASAGVIQIFTKKGARGTAPQWNMVATASMDHTLPFGTDSLPYMRFELGPWLRNALGMNYDVSVRGGGGDVQYFLAGQYHNADSPLPLDHINVYGLRGNLGFQASKALSIEWNTSLNRQDIWNTSQTNSSSGFPLNVYRGNRNYLNSIAVDSMALLLDYYLTSQINHLVSGVTLRYQPIESFTHRLTVGYDFSFLDERQDMPFGYVVFPQGVLQDNRWSNSILTADYAANLNWTLFGSVKNTLSGGAQLIQNETANVLGWSQGFAGPGEATVSGGASQVAQEDRQRVVTAGFFFENRVGVANNLFVTLGLRVDGNSAFGKSLGLQPYPKVSASYVLSDASFWPRSLGAMKLRAAWGQAGRAPGAFDAVKTYNAIRYGGTSGFLPLNLGDSTLGPERSTELELGFDAQLWNNRLSAEVTHYSRKTTDALFPVTQAPSVGTWNAQLENVGKMSGSGWEVNLQGTLLDNPTVGLDVGLSLATNTSKIDTLGGAATFEVGDGPAYAIQGEPAPVLRAWQVTNPNELADPVFQMYNYGPTYPTKIIGQNFELRYKGLVLAARGEYQGGFWMQNRLEEGDVGRNVEWPICSDLYHKIADQGPDALTAQERHQCVAKFSISSSDIQPGDFWKLRNVSLRVPLNFISSRPTVTFSAANAMKWIKMKYFDPEMAGQRAQLDPVRVIRDNVPPPATYSVTFRVSF